MRVCPVNWRFLFVALVAAAIEACVSFPDAPSPVVAPAIDGDKLRSLDGAALGLAAWEATEPHAVVVALHGMNDYSNAFALPGEWWARNAGVTIYALDQRGFGRSPNFGEWVGAETLVADLRAAVAAVRRKHPDLPVFVLGHSMGAAVIMAAQADAPLAADGLILASPGVWGGGALPLPYRLALNIAAGLAPGKTITGERAERQATDNIPILQQMFADPLVIKETRLDAVLGVVRLMGEAYGAADKVSGDILYLIGEKDEIIPVKAMEKAAKRICGEIDIRRYENGWHLLFRDLEREIVWRDVSDWLVARTPSYRNAADAGWTARPAAFQCASAGKQTAR